MKLRATLLLLVLLAVLIAKSARAGQLKVAVIDTGFDATYLQQLHLCDNELHHDFTGEGISDSVGHGTNVSGLIIAMSKATKAQLCLIQYKVYSEKATAYSTVSNTIGAIEMAIASKVDVINISMSGQGSSLKEKRAIIKALDKGIKVIVASGNSGAYMGSGNCTYFPACYDARIIVVGNGVKQASGIAIRHESSNYGPVVDLWIPGCITPSLNGLQCGSSMSAAIASGLLIKALLGAR
jgi:subtilisin